MCIRKHGCDLRDSCFSQMDWAARKLQVEVKKMFAESRMEMGNNARCLFAGLEEQRGISLSATVLRPKAVWIEEADQLAPRDYIFISKELHHSENPIIISTFNPPACKSHWLNKKIDEHLKHHGLNVSGGEWFFNPCYTEAEREWLGESFFREAEMLRRMNPVAYCHEYIGVPFED